jgi:hypothetical protein
LSKPFKKLIETSTKVSDKQQRRSSCNEFAKRHFAKTIGRSETKKPRNQAHGNLQILSPVEEKELERWIRFWTIDGKPPTYETVKMMAEGIRKRRVRGINVDGVEYT